MIAQSAIVSRKNVEQQKQKFWILIAKSAHKFCEWNP